MLVEPGTSTGEDIDECALGTDHCDGQHGICTNTEGGYACSCPAGWSLAQHLRAESYRRGGVLGTKRPWTAPTSTSAPWARIFAIADMARARIPRAATHARARLAGLWVRTMLPVWGGDHASLGDPPSGSFARVAVSSSGACGLTTEGGLSCWGSGYLGTTAPPLDTFLDVTVGLGNVCVVQTDHAVACWGSNYWGQSAPPAGAFQQLATGGQQPAPSSRWPRASTTRAGCKPTAVWCVGDLITTGSRRHHPRFSKRFRQATTIPAACDPMEPSPAGELRSADGMRSRPLISLRSLLVKVGRSCPELS